MQSGGLDGGRVFAEGQPGIDFGPPGPFRSQRRIRLHAPDDVGDDDVAARSRDAGEFTQALFYPDDGGRADAVGRVESMVAGWKAVAVGAHDGDEIAQVVEPGLGCRVMDERIVHVDSRDSTGEASGERGGRFAFPAGGNAEPGPTGWGRGGRRGP